MIVLAHGAAGPADELILLVPAVALLVLAVGALRRHNTRRAEESQPDGEHLEQPPSA